MDKTIWLAKGRSIPKAKYASKVEVMDSSGTSAYEKVNQVGNLGAVIYVENQIYVSPYLGHVQRSSWTRPQVSKMIFKAPFICSIGEKSNLKPIILHKIMMHQSPVENSDEQSNSSE